MVNVPKLQVVMAGSGKPYDVLTPIRLQIAHALHEGKSLHEIVEKHKLTNIDDELLPLMKASLIQQQNDVYKPSFFVANRPETENVTKHAALVGKSLASCLKSNWNVLEKTYCEWYSPEALVDHALILVGARILDIALLDILARDSRLMPPAPARPSPETPEAHYFLWMVEGSRDQLGRYGQRSDRLPWENWFLLSFGSYHIDEIPNEARKRFHLEAETITKTVNSPQALAEKLAVPVYNPTFVYHWTKMASQFAEELAAIYYNYNEELRALYHSLAASAYAVHGFGEFFC